MLGRTDQVRRIRDHALRGVLGFLDAVARIQTESFSLAPPST